MEIPLRASLIEWLAGDALLVTMLNSVTEEAPSRTALPWLAIATSASVDWSTKSEAGCETRIALELHLRGDRPEDGAAVTAAVQARVASLPRDQGAYRIVTLNFLRSRAEARPNNTRAMLLEYRFRTIAA
ncbi:DUF3168 domain-containing protein [Novosphingobium sp. KACC 22771]|uniref:DUF3168 domain-containing protein n=1 Tax=Novosphingobium sp. KACC 22771 TaxID=3025670 RepID=UPI002366E7C3|nr:DUF3168 domain-containing protein [Novosphingobium sp. KACC 22771]WDF72394.1 DUF3168 domain-containing protein [Novosphingobium sp. KACC 22771]